MSVSATSPVVRSFSSLLVLGVATAAVAGLSAVWAAVAFRLTGNAGWMSLVAAIDAALLLRLAGLRPGPKRALIATIVTLLTIASAFALIAATQIGLTMGMHPGEALGRMSSELVILYAQANFGWLDAFWLTSGLFVAWFGGR